MTTESDSAAATRCGDLVAQAVALFTVKEEHRENDEWECVEKCQAELMKMVIKMTNEEMLKYIAYTD